MEDNEDDELEVDIDRLNQVLADEIEDEDDADFAQQDLDDEDFDDRLCEEERWEIVEGPTESCDNDESFLSEATLENCLYLNQKYQEYVMTAINDLNLMLWSNKEKQKLVQVQLDEVLKKGKANCGYQLTSRRIGFPYFKDAQGIRPPPNEDTQTKKANQELQPLVVFPRLWKWSVEDNDKLTKAVEKNAWERHLQPVLARLEILHEELESLKADSEEASAKRQEIMEKQTTLKSKRNHVGSLIGERAEDYDWLKISTLDFKGEKSARECELYWKNYMHPSINKQKWSKRERQKLDSLVSRHGTLDWDKIADLLNTGRTAAQCAEKYLWKANQYLGKWRDEENKQLIAAVEACRDGDYIPFYQVAYFVEGRTQHQVYRRWTYHLDPSIRHGTWTEAEDMALLTAVWIYGARNWWKIKQCVKRRTDMQCSERWQCSLNPSINVDEYSAEEDKKLLALVEKYGKKWAKIGLELGRTNNRCQTRWRSLQRYDSETPLPSYSNLKRENYRKKLYATFVSCIQEVCASKYLLPLSRQDVMHVFTIADKTDAVLTKEQLKVRQILKRTDLLKVYSVLSKRREIRDNKTFLVEKAFDTYFSIFNVRKSHGRPPKLKSIQDNDSVYELAVTEFLAAFHANESAECVHFLPPTLTTMQSFRNLLILNKFEHLCVHLGIMSMRKRVEARMSLKKKRIDFSMTSSKEHLDYEKLFSHFVMLFFWPALLSITKPVEEARVTKPVEETRVTSETCSERKRKRRPIPRIGINPRKRRCTKSKAVPAESSNVNIDDNSAANAVVSSNEKSEDDPVAKKKVGRGRPRKNFAEVTPIREEPTRRSTRVRAARVLD